MLAVKRKMWQFKQVKNIKQFCIKQYAEDKQENNTLYYLLYIYEILLELYSTGSQIINFS